MASSKAGKTRFRSVTQNIPLIERDVQPVEFDARVERGNIYDFAHAGSVNRKLLGVVVIIVRLQNI